MAAIVASKGGRKGSPGQDESPAVLRYIIGDASVWSTMIGLKGEPWMCLPRKVMIIIRDEADR